MFADDIVVFARTADRQIDWKSCWMVLYLGVGQQVGDVSGSRQMWIDVIWCCSGECKRFEERDWILHGKPIEVVEEYTYLPRSEDYSRFE